MSIELIFACGHRSDSFDGSESQVACPRCGERVVTSITTPDPIFRGCVEGPHATYEDLPAKAVKLEDPDA